MPSGSPKFQTPEELEVMVDEYLGSPPIRTVITKDGPVNYPAITITGLAIHLGFESRQSLYDYEKKEGFSYIIKKARLYVENAYEYQLQFGNSTGAIFALKNMNWTDKIQNENLNVEVTHEQWLDGLK
jgi:hypothetical protein